jgi:very-short-patch-repair endonuclease
MTDHADTLAWHLRAAGLPEPVRELRFHASRRWRFDLAYPDRMVAIEVDGATWTGGRHTRGAGYEADCEKVNEAILAGWTVLRFTSGMVDDGRALATVERVLR